MRRVAAKIAYAGSGFCGSQAQPGLRTVMGEVAENLSRVHGMRDPEWFGLKCSSRTDRGVSALGNVVVFNTDAEDDGRLLRSLNSVSDGVLYRGAADVPPDFNPRYARCRVYRYLMPADGLDEGLVREAAGMFAGVHDFSGFCKADGRGTSVAVDSVEAEFEDGLAVLTFRARYFLWHMVRRMAAAVRCAGSGRAELSDIAGALAGGPAQFGVAEAGPLTLVDVQFDGLEFRGCGARSRRFDELRFEAQVANDFYAHLR